MTNYEEWGWVQLGKRTYIYRTILELFEWNNQGQNTLTSLLPKAMRVRNGVSDEYRIPEIFNKIHVLAEFR